MAAGAGEGYSYLRTQAWGISQRAIFSKMMAVQSSSPVQCDQLRSVPMRTASGKALGCRRHA